MTDFLPAVEQLEERLSLRDGERLETVERVTIDGDFLRFLIGQIASEYKLDPRAYRADNDVLTDLQWGVTASAVAHFSQSGYFSGLAALPRNFDEDWYLATYPDAKRAVGEGVFDDALAHYQAKGQAEFRLPNAASAAKVRAWRKALLHRETEDVVHLRPATEDGAGG